MNKKYPKDPAFAVAPSKFNMWLFMLASSMLFAAVVSAFIVHHPDAEKKDAWTAFDLPIYFLYSILLVVVGAASVAEPSPKPPKTPRVATAPPNAPVYVKYNNKE